MRKLYSLVLMATALLIGTNAWAELHDAPQQASDEAKVQINGGAWQYASTLKEAFDAVEMEQTATIVLLNHVTYERKSYSEEYGITIPHVIVAADMSGANAKQGPNITLNLNGKNIETGTGIHNDSITIFRLVKGTLNITGTGTIHKPGAIGAGESTWCGSAAIAVGGTNDKTATNWSTLTIGKDVTVHVETKYTKGYKTKAIAIVNQAGVGGSLKNPNDVLRVATSNGGHDNPANMSATYGYYTRAGNTYTNSLSAEEKGCVAGNVWGTAYGVKVIIEGTVIGPMYGVHMHGNINARPNCVNDSCEKRSKYLPAPYHQYQFPYINITSTAHVRATDTVGTTGIYSSGYGVLDVSGEVEGATGIYMKGGDVLLKDAIVKSNVTESGQNEGGNSGIGSAAGSGIVIETSEYYAGNSGVTVAGDTKVTGGGGYAIQDYTTSEELGSTTSHITIEGGTIEGGKEGAIVITEGTVDVTSIAGGNLSSNTVTVDKGNDVKETVTVNNFLVAGTHTTVVKDGNKDIVVVSKGGEPDTKTTLNDIIAAYDTWVNGGKQGEAPSVKATGTLGDLEQNLELKELEINETTSQTLTIKADNTLTVGRVILGANAQIIVEAGAKFIVTGTDGIVAPKVSNILIKTSETDQGIFLFNPKVSSNKYPNATVEFKSKAYLNGNKGVFQRFGVPTWNREDKTTSMKTASGTAKTWITQYDYAIDDWAAWTPYETATDIVIANALPFRGYMLYSNNDKDHKKDYTFEGNLIGNQNENLHMYYGWNYFANSYTAPISIKDLIHTVMASLDADKQDYVLGTIYLYKNTGDDDYTWSGVNLNTQIKEFVIVDNAVVEVQNQLDIQPMQAFLMRLNLIDGEMDQPISYEYDVYNPNMGIANNNQYLAPARAAQANNEMHVLVSGEGSWDKVYVVENNNFSNDFENGYDAYKYDGKTGVNLYAMNSDARMEILATDDAEGTFLGIDAPKAGNYTLHVAGVKGMEYAIVDMENNTVFEAVDGAKYEFYANAGVNDYRFQVVAAAKMPTAIENTEDIKKVNGVYTITGQFLGNDLNALPAGVYIVNGVKVVK